MLSKVFCVFPPFAYYFNPTCSIKQLSPLLENCYYLANVNLPPPRSVPRDHEP